MNFGWIILIGFISGIIFDYLFAAFSNDIIKKEFHMLGFRTHHTVFGLFMIVIGFFVYSFFLISFGIGTILSHTYRTNEFVFIEFDKGRKGKRLFSWRKMRKNR